MSQDLKSKKDHGHTNRGICMLLFQKRYFEHCILKAFPCSFLRDLPNNFLNPAMSHNQADRPLPPLPEPKIPIYINICKPNLNMKYH